MSSSLGEGTWESADGDLVFEFISATEVLLSKEGAAPVKCSFRIDRGHTMVLKQTQGAEIAYEITKAGDSAFRVKGTDGVTAVLKPQFSPEEESGEGPSGGLDLCIVGKKIA